MRCIQTPLLRWSIKLKIIQEYNITTILINIYSQEDENWTIDIENFNCTKMDMNKPDEKALWNKFVDGGMDDWEGKKFEKDHIF